VNAIGLFLFTLIQLAGSRQYNDGGKHLEDF